MIEKLNVRAVIFDAVGTLFYASPSVTSVYAQVGRRHGSQLTTDEVDNRFGPAFLEHYSNKQSTILAQQLAQQLDQQLAQQLDQQLDQQLERQCWQRVVNAVFADQDVDTAAILEELWEHFARPTSWTMFEDAAAAWSELAQSGLVMGIASNFDNRLLSVCEGFQLLQKCEHIYNSADVGFAKPDIRFFQHIQRQLDMPADQICLIGDDEKNDFQAAKNAGWKSLLIDRQNKSAVENDKLSSLRELLE